MKRISRNKELRTEVIVGTFMFVALIGLCIFTMVLSRENIFRTSYPMEVIFDDVIGLRDGDNVVVRGMYVGRITKLRLMRDGVHVFALLNEPVILKKDYKIEIIAASVLGGRNMAIDAGSLHAPELPPETTIRGITPIDLITESASVVSDLKKIAGKIADGEGTIGKLVNDDSLYTDAQSVIDEIKYALKEKKLLQNMEMAAANLNEISRKINSGEGTIGKLVNDETLYQDTKRILSDAQSTLNDYRETAPIVTFTSIFFGAL